MSESQRITFKSLFMSHVIMNQEKVEQNNKYIDSEKVHLQASRKILPALAAH